MDGAGDDIRNDDQPSLCAIWAASSAFVDPGFRSEHDVAATAPVSRSQTCPNGAWAESITVKSEIHARPFVFRSRNRLRFLYLSEPRFCLKSSRIRYSF